MIGKILLQWIPSIIGGAIGALIVVFIAKSC